MELKGGVKTFYAKSRKQWRRWLEKNHAIERSVWLIIYKKGAEIPTVFYPEAVEEAICFGWIDSRINKRDELSYFQYFARRNPKSKWSKVNKDNVEKLLNSGLIHSSGLEMIELAKKSGTWNALDETDNLIVPKDLKDLFSKNKMALKNWNGFSKSSRKVILEWIQNAKRPETRIKRIQETVRLATIDVKANFPI